MFCEFTGLANRGGEIGQTVALLSRGAVTEFHRRRHTGVAARAKAAADCAARLRLRFSCLRGWVSTVPRRLRLGRTRTRSSNSTRLQSTTATGAAPLSPPRAAAPPFPSSGLSLRTGGGRPCSCRSKGVQRNCPFHGVAGCRTIQLRAADCAHSFRRTLTPMHAPPLRADCLLERSAHPRNTLTASGFRVARSSRFMRPEPVLGFIGPARGSK